MINSEAKPHTRAIVENWRPHRPLHPLFVRAAYGGSRHGTKRTDRPLHHAYQPGRDLFTIGGHCGVYLGRGPAILTSILGVAAFDYFFVPPHLTFVVANTEYLLTFFGLLAVGLVISQLTSIIRGQAEAVQRREVETVELYELGRDLTVAADPQAVTQAAIAHISQTFTREVAIFLPKGRAKAYATSPGMVMDDNELKVAEWVMEHGQVAGRGTDNQPEVSMRYQPLKTTRGVVGVLGIKPLDPSRHLTRDQLRTLDAFANQIGLAIERASLAEQARQAETAGGDRQTSECPAQLHLT